MPTTTTILLPTETADLRLVVPAAPSLAPDADVEAIAQRSVVMCGELVPCYLLVNNLARDASTAAAGAAADPLRQFVASLDVSVDVAFPPQRARPAGEEALHASTVRRAGPDADDGDDQLRQQYQLEQRTGAYVALRGDWIAIPLRARCAVELDALGAQDDYRVSLMVTVTQQQAQTAAVRQRFFLRELVAIQPLAVRARAVPVRGSLHEALVVLEVENRMHAAVRFAESSHRQTEQGQLQTPTATSSSSSASGVTSSSSSSTAATIRASLDSAKQPSTSRSRTVSVVAAAVAASPVQKALSPFRSISRRRNNSNAAAAASAAAATSAAAAPNVSSAVSLPAPVPTWESDAHSIAPDNIAPVEIAGVRVRALDMQIVSSAAEGSHQSTRLSRSLIVQPLQPATEAWLRPGEVHAAAYRVARPVGAFPRDDKSPLWKAIVTVRYEVDAGAAFEAVHLWPLDAIYTMLLAPLPPGLLITTSVAADGLADVVRRPYEPFAVELMVANATTTCALANAALLATADRAHRATSTQTVSLAFAAPTDVRGIAAVDNGVRIGSLAQGARAVVQAHFVAGGRGLHALPAATLTATSSDRLLTGRTFELLSLPVG